MKIKKIETHFYLMMLPGMIWLFFFSFIPILGNIIAFQDFNPVKGFLKSEWIGLENFRYMFELKDFRRIMYNTVFLSVCKIIAHLIVPLVFALLLNEVRQIRLKKAVQTIVYLPHFLSWVILSGIVIDILLLDGPVNSIIRGSGGTPVIFLSKPEFFPAIVVISDTWKEYGYAAIIYIAGLTSIDRSLYESAAVDGTNKFQDLIYITLPGISTTIVLLATLSLGRVLNAGFEQIFNLYNPLVYETGDIIDTWVFRTGLINLDFGLATAVGIFKSLIGFFLITLSYYLADRFANYRIF